MPKGPNTRELDLRRVDGFVSAIEWVKNHIVLGADKHPAMRLDVMLPGDGSVSLFMNTANHYVLGFRGREKICLLSDPHIEAFATLLVNGGLAGSGELERLDLGADHGSLATLKHAFSMAALRDAARLSQYSSRLHTYAHIREPVSLMVCMIAESARLRTMEWAFRGIYLEHAIVRADEAIQSWQDACEILRLSDRYFPHYMRHLGVEKLEKRAAEMSNLIEQIEASGHGGKAKIQQALDGTLPRASGAPAYAVERLREMARELGIRAASEITTIVTSCKNKVAIRAAKDGVAVPG